MLTSMKRTFKGSMKVMAIAVGFSSVSFGPVAYGAAVGEQFPKIATKHVATDKSAPVEVAGKVTLINFWATWCESCKVELKEMETDFKGLFGEQDLQIKFISLDKDPAKAVEWFKVNLTSGPEMKQRLYADPDFKAADLVGVDAFPMTVIIDKNGKISYIQRGFKPGEHQIAELVRVATELLKK